MDYLNSSKKTLLSNYEHNPLLRLVFFCASAYIALHLVKIVLFMWQQVPLGTTTQYFYDKIYLHFAIQPYEGMKTHPWTLLSFMFTGLSFFKLFTSLVWLFLFGSVIQQLVGKAEIIPMFIFSNIIGGLFFIVGLHYFPIASPNNMFTGPDAAVLGFAFGALVAAPKYKVFFSSNFFVALPIIVLIYLILSLVLAYNANNIAYYLLMLGGVVGGVIYMLLAKNNYKLGAWGNNVYANIAKNIGNKHKVGDVNYINTNHEIDRILDKINEHGIQSLSKSEKELLKQFESKSNN